jgi:hypothetical protein
MALSLQATDADVYSLALSIAQEVASKFNTPLPKIVVGPYETGMYANGIIYLPSNLSPQQILRMAAHEMAHHIHSFYGVPCGTKEAETFASMFEEAWVKMKNLGYNYPVMPCQVCGFRLLMYGERVSCPKCGSTYKRVYNHSSPGLGKAVGLGMLSGLGAYFLATYFTKSPEAEKKPAEIAALASGLTGFFAGLIL